MQSVQQAGPRSCGGGHQFAIGWAIVRPAASLQGKRGQTGGILPGDREGPRPVPMAQSLRRIALVVAVATALS